jgi:hypothetical protein
LPSRSQASGSSHTSTSRTAIGRRPVAPSWYQSAAARPTRPPASPATPRQRTSRNEQPAGLAPLLHLGIAHNRDKAARPRVASDTRRASVYPTVDRGHVASRSQGRLLDDQDDSGWPLGAESELAADKLGCLAHGSVRRLCNAPVPGSRQQDSTQNQLTVRLMCDT